MKTAFTFVAFLCFTHTTVMASNAVIDDIRAKGETCRAMAQTAEGQKLAHLCLSSCARYGDTLTQYPELLSDIGVKRCHRDYARAQKGLTKTPPPVNRTQNAPAKVEPARTTMPDVEGLWTGILRGEMRVRADARTDWQQICRGTAMVMAFAHDSTDTIEQQKQRRLDQTAFFKQLKRKDQVRLIGITYDPARAGQQLHCQAERVEIIGSN
ncbi:hypothetical protein [Neptuniibacter sp. 1_MG-2023]|uniref:hypothetical protein n=1 Tax=Neptuniibacter sp. 1_MG-2023 TaxID=3062662 RepID=UPI0026E3CB1A|nr:hypothetical protein [Neptuniibacter sp. 1_MG-2023]MDO6593302.1 hypothetical protein [Neptuniibacter sp. 1_MG-2023]